MNRRPPADRSRLSRRSLLALAGAGVALMSAAAVWRGRQPYAEAARPFDPAAVPVVDHDGWIVTPHDKAALARQRRTP
jgi:hypothetical protein